MRGAGWNGSDPALVVLGARQRLYCLQDDWITGQWPVSTGAAGFGCQADSGCTPTGLHRIGACIGAGAQAGTVFKSRRPTGQIVADTESPVGDFITTRILWLEGLEEGHNRGPGVDTRDRYIYIHGTPHAQNLGQPVSAGCIRMSDSDVQVLFDRVAVGTLVLILPA
ncbi:MAG: L,D-transpeptidase [Magnetococcales bacterium]|nr:L,D-transpeptidase [Magnetococcales bacterium]